MTARTAKAQTATSALTAYPQAAGLGESAEQRHAAYETEMDRPTALHAAYWPPALHARWPALDPAARLVQPDAEIVHRARRSGRWASRLVWARCFPSRQWAESGSPGCF